MEGTFSYHTICHNHSYASMDCTSKIIKHIFESKFSCARTKCECIINNVLAPWCSGLLQDELEKVNFVSISVDTSNHDAIKIFPVIVRYYINNSGVNIKVLHFSSIVSET